MSANIDALQSKLQEKRLEREKADREVNDLRRELTDLKIQKRREKKEEFSSRFGLVL